MSKKTNYNKMSKAIETEAATLANEIVEPISTEVAEEVKPVVNVKQEIIYGKVVGCTKLNVRKEPASTAEIVRTVNKDDKIVINMGKSNDDFYCVRLGAIKGYCMKNYIEIIK